MRLRYLILVPVAARIAARWVPTNRVTIVNESGRTAQGVWVELSTQKFYRWTIPPGGTASAWYVTPGQDDYVTLWCKLEGGISIHENCIYTAWEEYSCDSTIVIREDGSTTVRY